MHVRLLILAIALMQGVAAAQDAPNTGLGDSPEGQSRLATPVVAPLSANSKDVPSGVDSGSTDAAPVSSDAGRTDIANPAIDMQAYLRVSAEAATHRQSHRVSEQEFLRMSQQAGTIVLDARSAEKYHLLHVKGAVNLSFPDITVASLQLTIPDRSTRILIYCNNNFSGAPAPFPSKLPSASLNLSTYIALYNYGYQNVYELGPLIDLKASRLEFEGNP